MVELLAGYKTALWFIVPVLIVLYVVLYFVRLDAIQSDPFAPLVYMLGAFGLVVILFVIGLILNIIEFFLNRKEGVVEGRGRPRFSPTIIGGLLGLLVGLLNSIQYLGGDMDYILSNSIISLVLFIPIGVVIGGFLGFVLGKSQSEEKVN